ncbi:MAG TPA: hypothetical protein VEO54_12220 [Thermoanaerobaculia bacterium]|nr:hypothetical protein [Thermoanaerobaculia bacterium]
MIGFTTIRTGERVAVWNRSGEVRYVDGPRRLLLWRESVKPLELHSARPDQYLVVRYVDGRVQHAAGPAAVWLDPVVHESIETRQAMSVSAHEAVVVYRNDAGSVDRRVVEGPAVFVPQPNEWLHTFRWHGADPKSPRRKIANALEFTRVRIIPDQLYFDVEEVRTADDALLCVKLMVFFELTSLETMLAETHDPIADFVNALTADVIDFAGAREFEQFKDDTERLNQLATYPQLAARAERIGYTINKVVYRGYHASDKLQAMHDNAIEARTRLRLEAETEQQAQELADLKLERETRRASMRQKMQEDELHHQNQLKRLAHDELMRQKSAEAELERRHQEEMNGADLSRLDAMRSLGVDLTPYLIAQYRHPDRVIRIDGDSAGRVQLHETN